MEDQERNTERFWKTTGILRTIEKGKGGCPGFYESPCFEGVWPRWIWWFFNYVQYVVLSIINDYIEQIKVDSLVESCWIWPKWHAEAKGSSRDSLELVASGCYVIKYGKCDGVGVRGVRPFQEVEQIGRGWMFGSMNKIQTELYIYHTSDRGRDKKFSPPLLIWGTSAEQLQPLPFRAV